ncbi:MAG: response regulator transcription factor [Bacilli bacterium]|nr:response regulator transcription factor [Bacilli bacterium]
MYKIGLVEDEKDLNKLITSYLEKEEYEVVSFTKGQDALDFIDNNNDIQLWILDIMLEDDITGYDIIKKVKEKNEEIPVIFSSARDESIDKIMGLELGSDDYLAKPYSPKELVLRVKNILKRVYSKDFHKIKYNDYEINTEERTVYLNDKRINLTTLEFELLLYLLNNKNKSLTREMILSEVWDSDYFGSDRVVDDSIRRLRKKMPELNINTVYGFGYRLS